MSGGTVRMKLPGQDIWSPGTCTAKPTEAISKTLNSQAVDVLEGSVNEGNVWYVRFNKMTFILSG